ncbi:gallidermin/nisin family lantibiotic [Lactococcus lactis]|nr:gallidermin/nisin family lantibiotic [Lactococcus lactis]
MSTKDFNLDLEYVSKTDSGASTCIASISLCTPGCKTDVLMG